MIGFIGPFGAARDYLQISHTQTSVLSLLQSFDSDFQRRTFPFLWFPNCPWPQLSASISNSSQRLNSSGYLHPLTNKLFTDWLTHQSQSYIRTSGQSVSLCWCQAPIRGPRPHFYYSRTVAGLFLWAALSDKRTGLSFIIAVGPRQRCHIHRPWTLTDILFMSFNTVFVMAIILSSSGSAPLRRVMVCWNIVATTVNMFRDELFALGAWTGWFGTCWLCLRGDGTLISRTVARQACATEESWGWCCSCCVAA
jgi:hypothetical protein